MKKNEFETRPDAFGITTMIGDEVIYIDAGYKDLKKGIVVGFTPQGFRIGIDKISKYSQHRPCRYVVKIIQPIKIDNNEK